MIFADGYITYIYLFIDERVKGLIKENETVKSEVSSECSDYKHDCTILVNGHNTLVAIL